jgi:hypothetical protein
MSEEANAEDILYESALKITYRELTSIISKLKQLLSHHDMSRTRGYISI